MDVRDLQGRLRVLGFYADALDGRFGPKSRAAFRKALTFPIRQLTDADIAAAAAPFGLDLARVGALVDVEASGRGQSLESGLPIIRYEGHQFRGKTGAVFDRDHPDLSFPYAERASHPQPAAQVERWGILEDAVALVPSAALESTSWGLGQIMGFNARACGFGDVWGFVRAMASGEAEQLRAVLAFLRSEGLLAHLQAKRWDRLAAGYNGPGKVDDYAGKLAKAYARRGGR